MDSLRFSSASFCLMILLLVIQSGGTTTTGYNGTNERSLDIYTTLKSLQDEVQNLRDELSVERDRRVSTLDNSLEVDDRRVPKRQRVAFYARVSPSIDNIPHWATIVFSEVITNDGNAYNKATGQFIAPISGTYVFYVNILSYYGAVIETNLKVNDDLVLFMYSGGQKHASGSNMAVVNLKAKDCVRVVKRPWGTRAYVHHKWSTFSGFFLYKN